MGEAEITRCFIYLRRNRPDIVAGLTIFSEDSDESVTFIKTDAFFACPSTDRCYNFHQCCLRNVQVVLLRWITEGENPSFVLAQRYTV